MGLSEFLQRGQRQVADERCFHQIGAVILLEKRHRGGVQSTLGFIGKGLKIANLETVGRVIAQ